MGAAAPSPGNGVSDGHLDWRFCCWKKVIFTSSLKLPFFYFANNIMLRKRAKGMGTITSFQPEVEVAPSSLYTGESSLSTAPHQLLQPSTHSTPAPPNPNLTPSHHPLHRHWQQLEKQ